jgi:hypothetical protein
VLKIRAEIWTPVLAILGASSCYLFYVNGFAINVPDDWPFFSYSYRVLEGDFGPVWDGLRLRRPVLHLIFYPLNAAMIWTFGSAGIYVNVVLQITICASLLYAYLRRNVRSVPALCTAVFFILYPSITNQTAAYMANYYVALSFTLVALLLVDRSVVLGAVFLLLSLWTIESLCVAFLIHPFLAKDQFWNRFKRTVCSLAGAMVPYAIWRVLLLPTYYQDDYLQSYGVVTPLRYIYHLAKGFQATFLISHITLLEYLSRITILHYCAGILVGLVLFIIIRKADSDDAFALRLNWVELFREKLNTSWRSKQGEEFSVKWEKLIRSILILCGLGLLGGGYLISPLRIATTYSGDGVLEPTTMMEIQLLRVILVVGGCICLFSGSARGMVLVRKAARRVREFLLSKADAQRNIRSERQVHWFYLLIVGMVFVCLGYVHSFLGSVQVTTNTLGEASRTNIAAVFGAALAFTSLSGLIHLSRLRKVGLASICVYVGVVSAYHIQLHSEAADMGELQRDVWNQMIDEVPGLTGKVCLVISSPDTVNVSRNSYANDWNGTPDIPTRQELPLAAVRAFRGVPWGENNALGLFYGVLDSSQVLLLTPAEVGLFLKDQVGFIRNVSIPEKYRGVSEYLQEPLPNGQIVLFSYRNGKVHREVSWEDGTGLEAVTYDGLGVDVVTSKLADDIHIQRTMRSLLLRRSGVL